MLIERRPGTNSHVLFELLTFYEDVELVEGLDPAISLVTGNPFLFLIIFHVHVLHVFHDLQRAW